MLLVYHTVSWTTFHFQKSGISFCSAKAVNMLTSVICSCENELVPFSHRKWKTTVYALLLCWYSENNNPRKGKVLSSHEWVTTHITIQSNKCFFNRKSCILKLPQNQNTIITIVEVKEEVKKNHMKQNLRMLLFSWDSSIIPKIYVYILIIVEYIVQLPTNMTL